MGNTNVYVTAEEKYLRSVILYPKTVTDNAHLCMDITKEKEITAKELLNYAMKQMIVVSGSEGEFFYPIAFKKTGSYVSIDVENKAGTKYTFHSKEQA